MACSGSTDSSSSGGKTLSRGDIAAIVIGTISGIAGIIGTFFGWRTWRRKRKNSKKNTSGNTDTQLVHAPPRQRPWEVPFPPDATVTYTRNTSSTINLGGLKINTVETYEVKRGGGTTSTTFPSRIISEVVDEEVD